MIEIVFCLALQDELTAEKAEELFVTAYKDYQGDARAESTKNFTRVYDKFPKEQIGAISAYNITCNLAIDSETAKALEWLKKALDAGYDNFEHLEGDSDLEGIRGEKKYEEMVAEAKKASKEKRAPIKEEEAKGFAERLAKAHKDAEQETINATFSRLGWFAHAKTVEWLNAELKKKGLKVTDENGGWQLVQSGD